MSASQSLLLKMWDLETGDEVRSWKVNYHPGRAYEGGISCDGGCGGERGKRWVIVGGIKF